MFWVNDFIKVGTTLSIGGFLTDGIDLKDSKSTLLFESLNRKELSLSLWNIIANHAYYPATAGLIYNLKLKKYENTSAMWIIGLTVLDYLQFFLWTFSWAELNCWSTIMPLLATEFWLVPVENLFSHWHKWCEGSLTICAKSYVGIICKALI